MQKPVSPLVLHSYVQGKQNEKSVFRRQSERRQAEAD